MSCFVLTCSGDGSLFAFFVSNAVVNVALAQTRPAAENVNSISALPTIPEPLAFSSEVAGRRTLIAARDAFRNAASAGYTAQIQVHVGTEPGKATRSTPFTETLKARLDKGLFSLTVESAVGRVKTVRRAVAAEGNLLVTRFEDRGNSKNPPIREYTQTSVDDAVPLSRALASTNFGPVSIASQWLLSETLPTLRYGTLWRGADTTEGVRRYVTLYEWESEAADRNRQTTTRARRYLLESKANRLVRFEEWERTTPRSNRGNESRLTYRRESYSTFAVGKQTYPLTAFSQALPASYTEKPPVRRVTAQLTLPSDTDPKALPVLERWRAAQERWVALDMQVEQTVRQTPRSREAQAQLAWTEALARYGIQLRRHGRTRVTQEWLRGGDARRFPRNAVFISDGRQLLATNKDTGRVRSANLDEPNELWRQLTRADLTDWGQGLNWIFTNPPNRAQLGYYTRIGYEGSTTTDTGEAVDIIVLERQDSDDRRGQVRDETVTLRIAIGSDGMPRWIDSRSETKISGILERDMPPTVTVFTRYRNIRTDQEPGRSAFAVSARN